MLDKDKVKMFYLTGYTSTEIAKKLNSNREAVKKCIQRNFKHLKLKHEESRISRREIRIATNRESKKYMSDRTFIMKNRNIYKTLPNGDVVLDKEKAGNVTWDTPRRLPRGI